VRVGIGWRRDKPHFDKISGLWLGSPASFDSAIGPARHGIDAEPRSLYMMTGASRQGEHSIPAGAQILNYVSHDDHWA
jgi:hypothetical protein